MSTSPLATSTTGKIFAVSTSHLDWDWSQPFENYYASGYASTSNGELSVSGVLYSAIQLILSSKKLNGQRYKYNLAEMAWLKRFLVDFPEFSAILATLQGSFYFLGGGVTSPDNLVCNGEAFIRNYLTGRSYLKKMGLGALISDVCWIPDDYGHDPQLPVVLKAMGMKGVSFARVCGNAPSVANTPLNSSRVSIDTLLKRQGVTFYWQADDDSEIVASFMFDSPAASVGYGVVWDQADTVVDTQFTDYTSGTVTEPDGTTGSYNIPGNIYMAPCGGDFSTPAQSFLDQINAYDQPGGNSNNNVTVMGTFEDYLTELNNKIENGTATLETYKGLDNSNFWTGYFSSRVQLKINQQQSVNRLLAAETLSTLLRCSSNISATALASLNQLIDNTWEHMAPSTHHDFITGTSGDPVYYQEQLPISTLALQQSSTALGMAMTLLATSMPAPATGDFTYVVFNPSGFDRQAGTFVQVPANSALGAGATYKLQDGTTGAVQLLTNKSMIVPLTNVNSMGYQCITLNATVDTPIPVVPPPLQAEVFVLENEYMRVVIKQSDAWAISSLYDKTNNTEIVAENSLCNELLVVSEGINGNIYQMGNELTPTTGTGFDLSGATGFTAATGSMVENGQYLQQFSGTVTHATCGTYIVEYTLLYNEPMVRMSVTGQVTDVANASSAITQWQVKDAGSLAPQSMIYGTPNHWNDPEKHIDEAWGYTSYWEGPTFRSTHDYLMLAQHGGADPLCAIYHEGMRAWAHFEHKLMGILFRNANNGGRGAYGSDTDAHTQNYAFRIQGVGAPATCQPLQESISFQQPLLVAPVGNNSVVTGRMPLTGQLASVSAPAMIRLARTQEGSGGVSTIKNSAGSVSPSFSFVLRIYQPTNIAAGTWNISIPCLKSQPSTPAVSFVTALEDELGSYPYTQSMNGVISLPDLATLTTVRAQVFDPPLYNVQQ